MSMKIDRRLYFLISVFLVFWVVTFAGTHNRSNWLMENALVACFLIVLAFTYRYVQFSTTSYSLILIFLLLHAYGAEFTYSKNPFGFWMKDILSTSRNPYDRLVHFSFGFLFFLPCYELFAKSQSLKGWISYWLPIMVIIAASGLSEIFEWMMTDWFFPFHGQTYLAAQGDIWDAQKDMTMATVGVLLFAFLFFLRPRDRTPDI